ncbi:RING finger protein [Endozoicomonas euniceicola]|uniref:RING-type domain-containing protein n=1 Tax=Endozoicomonas euniceicola TaxID=1234143 RepID=A0ABY6GRV3_9GAMM|nr:RING finger protein [Endozoicomonas euniceicola]UYM14818.1 hypothetical protein NX720_18255 [Endozoicomonas euniceicola]
MEATGYQPLQPQLSVDMDIDPDPNTRATFNGHTLQTVRGQCSRVINDIQQDNCSICFGKFEISSVRPTTVLNCYHAFHTQCIAEELKRQNKCPLCRTRVDKASPGITSDNLDSLKAMLPVECATAGCLVTNEDQATTYQCPYPMSTFKKASGHFMEHNESAIRSWLGKVLEQSGYSGRMKYVENYSEPGDCFNKPAILVSVQLGSDNNHQALFYSSDDINNGPTPEACFDHFLADVRTDLMMLSLKKRHPSLFEKASELHITGWSYPKNEIYTNKPVAPLSLTNTLDVEGKMVKWDGLKSELQRVGLEPNKLYHGKPAPKQTGGVGFSNPPVYFVTDHEGNHTSMPYEQLQQLQAAARAPLPTGQEILSRII